MTLRASDIFRDIRCEEYGITVRANAFSIFIKPCLNRISALDFIFDFIVAMEEYRLFCAALYLDFLFCLFALFKF